MDDSQEVLGVSVGSCTGAPREGQLLLSTTQCSIPSTTSYTIHTRSAYTHIHTNLAITVNISMSTRAVSPVSRRGGVPS